MSQDSKPIIGDSSEFDSIFLEAVGRIAPISFPYLSEIATLPITIDDHYQLVHLIGTGGMGIIYLARDLKLGRHVAVKLVKFRYAEADHPETLTQLRLFDREAKATGRLNHTNIIKVFDFGNYNGWPYIVLELLDGETLDSCLKRGVLEPLATIDMAIEVTEALAHAHGEGIIHRDLKPSNIFLLKGGHIRVLDFGLAAMDLSKKSFLSALQVQSDTLEQSLGSEVLSAGSPRYMSPEQWRGERQDERTDLWALGIILYEALRQVAFPELI